MILILFVIYICANGDAIKAKENTIDTPGHEQSWKHETNGKEILRHSNFSKTVVFFFWKRQWIQYVTRKNCCVNTFAVFIFNLSNIFTKLYYVESIKTWVLTLLPHLSMSNKFSSVTPNQRKPRLALNNVYKKNQRKA